MGQERQDSWTEPPLLQPIDMLIIEGLVELALNVVVAWLL